MTNIKVEKIKLQGIRYNYHLLLIHIKVGNHFKIMIQRMIINNITVSIVMKIKKNTKMVSIMFKNKLKKNSLISKLRLYKKRRLILIVIFNTIAKFKKRKNQ